MTDLPPIELEGLDDDGSPQREWNGGDTLPSGPLLREQIAYHLRKSWELANGYARDGEGQPITDRDHIAMSTRWHHEQAGIMATIYAAEYGATVELHPTTQVRNLFAVQVGVGDEVVGEVHTSAGF